MKQKDKIKVYNCLNVHFIYILATNITFKQLFFAKFYVHSIPSLILFHSIQLAFLSYCVMKMKLKKLEIL